MSRVIAIRLSDQLYKQLATHARGRGIRASEAARDLIRRGLGVVRSARDAGYEEGKLAAWSEHFKRLNGDGQ